MPPKMAAVNSDSEVTNGRKRTAAQTRSAIYDVSRRKLNELGFHGMTLRDIAREVGIEPQSIYNYASSKQDLVESLMRQGTLAIQESVDSAIARADPTATARLWAATVAHTRHYCDSDEVVLVREGLVHLDADRRADIFGLLKAYEYTFKRILISGVDSGEFREIDITPTCFAILGMGESVINWFDPRRRLSAQDVAHHYADLAVRTVVAEQR